MKTPSVKPEILVRLNAIKGNPKVVIALSAALFLLDAVFVLRFQFVSVGRVFSNTRQLSKQIRQVRDDARQGSMNSDKLENLKSEAVSLGKQIVNPEELPKALELISKYADNSGVRILRLNPIIDLEKQKMELQKPAAAPGKESYERQKISIIMKTGFHQLGRFVALLENSDIFFDILTVEIVSDQQEYTKESVTILLEVLMKKA